MIDNSEEVKPFLVRVVTDFFSDFSDEINCCANDLIQIEYKLDKYWLFGHLNGRSGKIPVANCREVDLNPDIIGDNQCLFAAITDFFNDCIDGDLRFRRGDLIVGFAPIDENWWNGSLYNNPGVMGILPLTHVWRLDPKLLPKKVDTNGLSSNVKYCKVMVEMRSQLDNEIDLFKDEVLKITENYDKMYFKGESVDGQRKGIFPKNFVQIVDNYQPINDQSTTNSEQSMTNPLNTSTYVTNSELKADNPLLDNPPSYDFVINSYSGVEQFAGCAQPSSLGYSNAVVGDVESYGRILFSFKAEYPNELSLKEGEIVHLIRHIDNEWIEGEVDGRVGIFPKSFVEIIVDCDLNMSAQNGERNISISEEFPPDSFGRVLYDFDGELEGDLRVKSGDTLTLIRKIDNNWLEVMDDLGSVGLVPNNYVELIDDSNLSITASIPEDVSTDSVDGLHVTSDENHIYSNTSSTLNPDVTINKNVLPEIIQELDPLVGLNSDNNNCNRLSVSDIEVFEAPKKSPKIPRRPAPAVPQKGSSMNVNSQQVSPHRPPPPVPKHKSNKRLQRSTESVDSLNFIRHESIRSSITSNSSSGSAKSETTASGVTLPQPSAEDQRRAEERKKKVREQRGCVIMELLQTERDYKQSLAVCADIFLKNPEEGRSIGIDSDRLFGNLEEIIEVSTRLVQLLEESTLMKTYEMQRVGKCFLEVADQMKTAYSVYCRNHEDIQPLWNRYEAQPEAKQYLQKGFDEMNRITNCFDIPSVLIKPVQRILKYPLLLNELHKCTEDGHEDKPDLILAIDLITNLATNINESKRRQDLVYKYREEPSHRLTARLSKLNLHTVMKKGSRLGHRITSTLGLSSTTKDDEFNREVQKFRTVEKTIKIFVKDKQSFMKSAQDFSNQGLTVVEAIAEYYDKKNRQQEVEQLRTTHRTIVTQYWTEFNLTVDRDVTPVLEKLLSKFSGPNQLIRKRFDKLTDYDSLSKKLECNKDPTRQRQLQEQQSLSKNVYEALNHQLLEELPKLCDLSMQILQDCIQAFLLARKQLIGRIAKHHLTLLELPLVVGFGTGGSAADVNETFKIKHNLITEQLLDEISILPPNVFPDCGHKTDIIRRQSGRSSRRSLQLNNINISVANTRDIRPKASKYVPQSGSQRAYLQSRYQKYQLYEAVKPYEAVDVLDICLSSGDLVGVIKQQDPMGGKHRWYVDTGSAQGFVLSSILIPYHEDGWSAPPNWDNTTKQYLNGQTITEKSPRPQTQSPNPSTNDSFSQKSSPNPSVPTPVQHQYKLHPVPDPPVPLRNEVEQHRYEEVDDSPPRYSRLGPTESSNLLSFDESVDEKRVESQLYYNLGEFDPYAPIGGHNTSITANDNRYEEIPEDSPPPPPTPQRQSSQTDVYFAAYPFTAGDSNQLSLEFGQPVVVEYRCDLKGNPEWWFVKDREGNTGYVPANYLTKHKSN